MSHRLLVLVAVASALFPSVVQAQVVGTNLGSRWTTTSATPSAPNQGDSVVLRWSIVPDGTLIPRSFAPADESDNPSDLISALDAAVPGGSGSDLTLRPWFHHFVTATNAISSVSGITFEYQAADDGAVLKSLPGQTGVRGDVRIGAHLIDGGSDTLAYNLFPQNGDMVIDTADIGGGVAMAVRTTEVGIFASTIMHELGHGLGLSHVDGPGGSSLSVPQIMEPFVNLGVADVPMLQFNDILALQRMYGDAGEKGAGNDTLATASALGPLLDGTPLEVGSSATNTLYEVTTTDTDFMSIDGIFDADVYEFLVSQAGLLTALLDPRGPTYSIGLADLPGSPHDPFDAMRQNNLMLEILASDGSILASMDSGLVGDSETIAGLFLTAGTYYARVTGLNDQAQMYSLNLSIDAAAVPEPSTFVFLSLGALAAGFRYRRKRQLDVVSPATI